MPGAPSLRAEVKEVRNRTHEPRDPKVVFVMAVVPGGDVLSFVAKKDGKWRLTRIQNWLDKNPLEQTIDIPGVAIPTRSKDASMFLSMLSTNLLVSREGRFAVSVATGYWANNGRLGGSFDHIVSVIDLNTLSVQTTIHQDGILEYFTDRVGRLVTQETMDPNREPIVPNQARSRGTTLKFFTLPDFAPAGFCNFTETLQGRTWVPHDRDCGTLQELLDGLEPPRRSELLGAPPCSPAGTSRDGLYGLDSCGSRVAIYSAGTGALVGAINETTRDSMHSDFASLHGHNYLLVIEGGTQLKVYEITPP
jgi:hypothetical protein